MVYKRSKSEIDMISRSCQIVADTLEMISEYVFLGFNNLNLIKKLRSLLYPVELGQHLRDIWVFHLLFVSQ